MFVAFIKMLLAMGQVQQSVDFIKDLPTEVAANILRYLDDESLVAAAGVCNQWKEICHGDIVLRRRIRRKLRADKMARIQAYYNASEGVEVIRKEQAIPFGHRNGNVTVQVKPVQYEKPKNIMVPQMKPFKVNNRKHPVVEIKKMKVKKNRDVCYNHTKTTTNRKTLRI